MTRTQIITATTANRRSRNPPLRPRRLARDRHRPRLERLDAPAAELGEDFERKPVRTSARWSWTYGTGRRWKRRPAGCQSNLV